MSYLHLLKQAVHTFDLMQKGGGSVGAPSNFSCVFQLEDTEQKELTSHMAAAGIISPGL